MHANIESPEIECLQGRNHKGLQKPHLNVRNSLKCNNGIFKKDKNNTVAKSRRIEKINTSLRILDLKLLSTEGVKQAWLIETSGMLPRLEIDHDT